jgi:prepilin-type N-terminal cleavage/methylation domain-containing protein
MTLKGNKGFTLIELMATLVIISVLSAVFVQRYAVATQVANTVAGQALCSDLNAREMGQWGSALLARGYDNDDDVWERHHQYLGDIKWVKLTQTGGTAVISGTTADLNRTPSKRSHAAVWSFK